jgi:hypothetical protein
VGSVREHPEEPREEPGASRSPASFAVASEEVCGVATDDIRARVGRAEEFSRVIAALHRSWQ